MPALRTKHLGGKFVRVKLVDLHEDPNNARRHGERNLKGICASFSEFGNVQNIVVQAGTGRVIGGNARFRVLSEAGVEETLAVEVDADELDAANLGILLNRSGELAQWDHGLLRKTTAAAQDQGISLEAMGWTADELDMLDGVDFPQDGTHTSGREQVASSYETVRIEGVSLQHRAEVLEAVHAALLEAGLEYEIRAY